MLPRIHTHDGHNLRATQPLPLTHIRDTPSTTKPILHHRLSQVLFGRPLANVLRVHVAALRPPVRLRVRRPGEIRRDDAKVQLALPVCAAAEFAAESACAGDAGMVRRRVVRLHEPDEGGAESGGGVREEGFAESGERAEGGGEVALQVFGDVGFVGREAGEEEVVVVCHGGVVEDVCFGGLAGGQDGEGFWVVVFELVLYRGVGMCVSGCCRG